MCMDCGCKKFNDDHGNPDHITMEKLQRAAKASGMDMETAADNIHASAKMARDSGQGSHR